jgi:hypothetical protein
MNKKQAPVAAGTKVGSARLASAKKSPTPNQSSH